MITAIFGIICYGIGLAFGVWAISSIKSKKTNLYDINGEEANDGSLIFQQGKPFELYEVYWDERYQWSYRNHPENKYGAKNFHGRLTSSKFIVPEDMKWELLKD